MLIFLGYLFFCGTQIDSLSRFAFGYLLAAATGWAFAAVYVNTGGQLYPLPIAATAAFWFAWFSAFYAAGCAFVRWLRRRSARRLQE
jgi:hypothetical protein